MKIKCIKASLILNKQGEVGFFYGEDLGLKPEWVQIDAERGEVYVYDSQSNSVMLQMEPMTDAVYARIMDRQEILLVQVADDDIRKPVSALWVSLSVSQQI
ncbi:MAG: hypothetical protein H6858_02700 [Rhodospirillales bacterium]|nr:hypothetical protein [Alphaproteobacteria bacterium]MCB1838995.1 hypothetical protein [Alphaproteobacteria bacterium]MCB9976493.1 hypothetical protein [Rhodospirillales bacterium]